MDAEQERPGKTSVHVRQVQPVVILMRIVKLDCQQIALATSLGSWALDSLNNPLLCFRLLTQMVFILIQI